MIIFGAGVLGELTLHACRQKGIPVECFIDDRQSGTLLGVDIVHGDRLRDSAFEHPAFYLTSPNIEDMIVRLREVGYDDWRSCGDVLRDFDVSGIRITGKTTGGSPYTPEHLKYLVRTCLHHHDNYFHPERLTVQSVDLIVTERCSMKCKDCSNLMQYYEKPENADLQEMKATIDRFCVLMDEVYEFRVIGGEPFMNKEVHLVVEHLTSKPNVHKVSIFTNGTIVPRETQWSALTHEKVRFFITEYDLSRNLGKLVNELDVRGIHYVCEKANNWTDCASLEKHDRTIKENEALFSACCAKNLATLADGKLYRCPFAANAFKLQAVPDYTGDYLDVSKASKEEVRQYLRGKTYLKSCDHCNGRSYGDTVIVPAVQTKEVLRYRKYGAFAKSV